MGVPFPSKDLDKPGKESSTDWTNVEVFEAKNPRIYFQWGKKYNTHHNLSQKPLNK